MTKTSNAKLLVVSIVKRGNRLAGEKTEAENAKKAALESVLKEIASRYGAKIHKLKTNSMNNLEITS